MYYFGYYLQNGTICSVKWKGSVPVGGTPTVIVQKQSITEEQFKHSLSSLSLDYPYRELP